jgi:hypothetical protein
VATTKKVMSPRISSFRYSSSINYSTNQIEASCYSHPIQAYSSTLNIPTINYEAIDNKGNCRKSKARVYSGPKRPKGWSMESMEESSGDAKSC